MTIHQLFKLILRKLEDFRQRIFLFYSLSTMPTRLSIPYVVFTSAICLFHCFVNISETGTRCHLLLHLPQNISRWPHGKRQHVVIETLWPWELELGLNLRHVLYSSEPKWKCYCEDIG